jgi:hypothetical protein
MFRILLIAATLVMIGSHSEAQTQTELLKQIAGVSSSLSEAISSVPELQDYSQIKAEALEILTESVRTHASEYVSALPIILYFGTDKKSLSTVGAQTLFWITIDGNLPQLEKKLTRLTAKKYLAIGWNNFNPKSRWNNFDTVVPRLGAPILLDKYLDSEFKHSITKRGGWSDPRIIFRDKNGSCFHLAAFGVYIMRLAGYSGCDIYWDKRVPPKRGLEHLPYGHTVAAMKNENTYIVFVDFRPNGKNKMSKTLTYEEFHKRYELRKPGPSWMNVNTH